MFKRVILGLMLIFLICNTTWAVYDCGIKQASEFISVPLKQPLDSAFGIERLPDSVHIVTYADNASSKTFSTRSTTYPFSDVSIDTTKDYNDTLYWFVDQIQDIDGGGGNFVLAIDISMFYDKLATHTHAKVQIISDSLNTVGDSAILAAKALKPTTAGRTLDVTATGEAGIDLDNVNGTLSNSEIETIDVNVVSMAAGVVTAAAIATNAVDADAVADNTIDAGAIAADAIGASEIATSAIGAAEIAAAAINISEMPTIAYFDTLIYRGYRGPGVWVDKGASNTDTDIGVDGTEKNPVSTLAAAKTIADNLGYQRYYIMNRSTFTGATDSLAVTHEDWEFIGIGEGNALALDFSSTVDVDGSFFYNLNMSGGQGGTDDVYFQDCHIEEYKGADGHFSNCGLMDTIFIGSSDDLFLENCHSMIAGGGRPGISFGAGISNLSMRRYSGGIELREMAGTDKASIEGMGQVVVNDDCTSAPITIRGFFTITPGDAGSSVITKDAVFTRAEADLWIWSNVDTSANSDTSEIVLQLIDRVWDEDSTGHYTSPNMAFVASQTGAGVSITDADMGAIGDTVWAKIYADAIAVSGGIGDSLIAKIIDIIDSLKSHDDWVAQNAYFDTLIYLGGVWVDNGANTNTVVGVDGTPKNPVGTIAAAKTIADALGYATIYFLDGASETIGETMEHYKFCGITRSAAVNLGSQDVDGSFFHNMTVIGQQGGTGSISVINSGLGALDSLQIHARNCAIMGPISLRGGIKTNFFDKCYSSVAGNDTPVLDFNDATDSIYVNWRAYSGGLELQNMTTNQVMSYESDGQLVINANCDNGVISARGMMTITDNGTTMSITKDAVFSRAEADLWIWANVDTTGAIDTSEVGDRFFDHAIDSTIVDVSAANAANGLTAAITATVWGAVTTSATVEDSSGNTSTRAQFNLVEATDDHYNDMAILFLTGAESLVLRRITDYDGTNKYIVWTPALTAAPATGVLAYIWPWATTNVGAISSDGGAADSLKAILDGTRATLFLNQLTIVVPDGDKPAIVATGNGTGEGIAATGGATNASGIKALGQGNGSGLVGSGGSGTGHGIEGVSGAGATGDGIHGEALSTNGNGMGLVGAGTGKEITSTDLVDDIWDEDSTGHYTDPQMAFLASQTGAGSSITDADMAAIADTVWQALMSEHDNVAGSFGDSAKTWKGGGGGLDSAFFSRVIKRLVWGIPTGSGSDSSTMAQRRVDSVRFVEFVDSVRTLGSFGSGLRAVTIFTANSADTSAIPGINFEVRNQSGVTIFKGFTDANGKQVLALTENDTILVISQGIPNWNFPGDSASGFDSIFVTQGGDFTDTIYGTVLSVTAPSSSDLIRLYAFPRDISGNKVSGAKLVVQLRGSGIEDARTGALITNYELDGTITNAADSGFTFIDVIKSRLLLKGSRSDTTDAATVKYKVGINYGTHINWMWNDTTPDSSSFRITRYGN